MLQFFDLRCDDHCPGSGNKDDGADSHHCVDKVVAEHFQKRWQGVGSYDPEDRFHPVVAHQHRSRLPGGVHLFQRTFHHQIWRGKIMHHVAQDHQKKRILQGSSGERQEKCDTNDHSGNRICHKRNALEYILHVLRQLAPRRDKRSAVCGQRAGTCGQKCDEKRVFKDFCKNPVLKYFPHMFRCKCKLIGPFLHKRHKENDGEDQKHHNEEYAAENPAEDVPYPVFLIFDSGDLVVPHIVPLQIMQE